MSDKDSRIKILFICTANACRSQMAEGWTRHLAGESFEAFSAGTFAWGMSGKTVRVMAEAGVDISSQRSEAVEDYAGREFDYVLTLSEAARAQCPEFGGRTRVLHVPFDDPPQLAASARTEEDALPHYRKVRDDIRAFVEQMPGVLEKLSR